MYVLVVVHVKFLGRIVIRASNLLGKGGESGEECKLEWCPLRIRKRGGKCCGHKM